MTSSLATPSSAGELKAIRLENERVSATIAPQRGADVLELYDRMRDLQVLWKSPAWGHSPANRTSAEYGAGASFFDHYPGGMQEILPNGGPSCTYEGAQLGFHGEACKLPWTALVAHARERCEVRCTTRLSRLPLVLSKTFSLAPGECAVRIEASITNVGRRDLHYMWGFHAALGQPLLGVGTRLYCDARRLRVHDEPFGARQHLPAGGEYTWPLADGRDRSLLSAPDDRSADLWYLDKFTDGWCVVENAALDILVTLRWELERFPYLWLWQECHDDAGYPWFGEHHMVGVEPFSSYPASGLLAAIENGTAPLIEAGATHEATLSIGISAREGSAGTPVGVDPSGTVHYVREG
jgi:galactose mutarotase-like enzyme